MFSRVWDVISSKSQYQRGNHDQRTSLDLMRTKMLLAQAESNLKTSKLTTAISAPELQTQSTDSKKPVYIFILTRKSDKEFKNTMLGTISNTIQEFPEFRDAKIEVFDVFKNEDWETLSRTAEHIALTGRNPGIDNLKHKVVINENKGKYLKFNGAQPNLDNNGTKSQESSPTKPQILIIQDLTLENRELEGYFREYSSLCDTLRPSNYKYIEKPQFLFLVKGEDQTKTHRVGSDSRFDNDSDFTDDDAEEDLDVTEIERKLEAQINAASQRFNKVPRINIESRNLRKTLELYFQQFIGHEKNYLIFLLFQKSKRLIQMLQL